MAIDVQGVEAVQVVCEQRATSEYVVKQQTAPLLLNLQILFATTRCMPHTHPHTRMHVCTPTRSETAEYECVFYQRHFIALITTTIPHTNTRALA